MCNTLSVYVNVCECVCVCAHACLREFLFLRFTHHINTACLCSVYACRYVVTTDKDGRVRVSILPDEPLKVGMSLCVCVCVCVCLVSASTLHHCRPYTLNQVYSLLCALHAMWASNLGS